LLDQHSLQEDSKSIFSLTIQNDLSTKRTEPDLPPLLTIALGVVQQGQEEGK